MNNKYQENLFPNANASHFKGLIKKLILPAFVVAMAAVGSGSRNKQDLANFSGVDHVLDIINRGGNVTLVQDEGDVQGSVINRTTVDRNSITRNQEIYSEPQPEVAMDLGRGGGDINVLDQNISGLEDLPAPESYDESWVMHSTVTDLTVIERSSSSQNDRETEEGDVAISITMRMNLDGEKYELSNPSYPYGSFGVYLLNEDGVRVRILDGSTSKDIEVNRTLNSDAQSFLYSLVSDPDRASEGVEVAMRGLEQ